MSTETRVHDVRFTRFEGELDGEGAAIISLARWSALRSMGARRSWKVKLIPIALTLIAFAPAVVVLGLGRCSRPECRSTSRRRCPIATTPA